MSLSPIEMDQRESNTTYLKNWDQLGTLISQGRSFSGRERNCCFLNLGQSQDGTVAPFADVSAAANLDDVADSRAVAYSDWDHDGDLDLWTTTRSAPGIRFVRNELDSKNQFLAIRLQGRKCNRDAIGSRVTIELEDEQDEPNGEFGDSTIKLVKTLRAGDAFVSQSSKWLHFGIPRQKNICRVTVRWPGTDVPESITGCKPNGRFQFIQGTGTAKEVTSDEQRTASLKPAPLELPEPTDVGRVVLTRRRKVPKFAYIDFQGQRQTINSGTRGPILINLWASWCVPCVTELNDLKSNAAVLREKNLRVLALSTDGAEDGQDRSDIVKAAQLVHQLKLPFASGVAGKALLGRLRVLHSQMFYKDKPLPIPTSFLLDENGSIVIVYRGPVDARQLINDLDLIQSYDAGRVTAALYPLGGRSGIGILPTDGLGFGKAYYEGGYDDDAKRELNQYISKQSSSRDSAERRIDLATAYHLLGKVDERLENVSAAIKSYQAALRLEPNALGGRVSLALALWNQGQHATAEQELQVAEKHMTNPLAGHRILGRVRLQWNQPQFALRHFRSILRDMPSDVPSRLDLATALRAAGMTSEAIDQYRQLLKLDPKNLIAANGLAWIYSTCADTNYRNGEEALRIATEIVSATQRTRPDFLDTLAAALAETGDFQKAAETAEVAIAIASENNLSQLAEQLEVRLGNYRKDLPFRESTVEPSRDASNE